MAKILAEFYADLFSIIPLSFDITTQEFRSFIL